MGKSKPAVGLSKPSSQWLLSCCVQESDQNTIKVVAKKGTLSSGGSSKNGSHNTVVNSAIGGGDGAEVRFL